MNERYWWNIDTDAHTVTEGQELPWQKRWIEISKEEFEEWEEKMANYEMYRSALSNHLNGRLQEWFQKDPTPMEELAETIKQAFCDLVDDVIRIDKFLLDNGVKL